MPDLADEQLLAYLRAIRRRTARRGREWFWPGNAARPRAVAYALEYEPVTLALKVAQYARRRAALRPFTRSQRPRAAGDVGPVEPVRFASGNRRLVVAHAFYPAESRRIFDQLLAPGFAAYDVVVTTPDPALRDDFLARADPARAACLPVPNAGRDVRPFLLAVAAVDAARYDAFVKVHGKRSGHLAYGGDWFGANVESLIGDAGMTGRILDRIDPGRPGLYGVDVRPATDHYHNNRHWLRALTGRRRRPRGHRFVPGTMFAGSGDYLRRLAGLRLDAVPAEPEAGQLDGCLAHAMERYFGYLATAWGGTCDTLEALAAGTIVA